LVGLIKSIKLFVDFLVDLFETLVIEAGAIGEGKLSLHQI
jgi:prolyl-tRNA editing enzyme YbaK/EbsC (Cys-tRNA(Pro) deacylase)